MAYSKIISLRIGKTVLIAFAMAMNVQAQDFYLHENGVTVMCPAAEVGEKGVVEGELYEKIGSTDDLIFHGGSVSADEACTSGITYLYRAFSVDPDEFPELAQFNKDISHWDVSSVKTMERMFQLAGNFNQDIGFWDVSNVTDMSVMFSSARSFNQDLGSWDVSNVTDMSSMFSGAENFNQDISSWDVGNVEEMSSMFREAINFNQNLNSWDVSSVRTMSQMFYEAENFNQDISSWDVSNVTGMSVMFFYAKNFNQDIGSWDVSSVTDMSGMFNNATSFNQDVGSWDVSGVTDISRIFFRAISFNQDLSKWDVSSATDMHSMFYGAQNFNQNIANWNVSNVKNMREMFRETIVFDQNLNSWDVSSVTNMSGMFNEAAAFNHDISSWDVSNVIQMNSMFRSTQNFNQDIGSWDVSKVTNMDFMFNDAVSFNQDLSMWCVEKIESRPRSFETFAALTVDHYPVWGTCPGKPGQIFLSSPFYGTEDIPITPTFNWKKDSLALEYQLQLYISESPESIIVDTTVEADSLILPFSLEYLTDYDWKVRGINKIEGTNGYRMGEWSDTWSFTTIIQPPDTVSLLIPEYDAWYPIWEAKFVWSARDRAEEYYFELSKSEGFEPMVVDSTITAPDTSLTLSEGTLEADVEYYWRVKAGNAGGDSEWSQVFRFTGNGGLSTQSEAIPEEYSISQNYPNPFNPSTQIKYGIPRASGVRVEVFNMLGQKVAELVNERQPAGRHTVTFTATELSSGIYFFKIEAGEFVRTRKMLLVK